MMRLVHYANKPITEVLPVTQTPYRYGSVHIKPNGLWVSVEGEDDWRSWCLSENFGLERLTHIHDVTLNEGANVLHIHGPAGIDAFTQKYGARYDWGMTGVRWQDVADDYDALIIAPYVWSRRLDGAPVGITVGIVLRAASGSRER